MTAPAKEAQFEAVFFDHARGYLAGIDADGLTHRRYPGEHWRQVGRLKEGFTPADWIRSRESGGHTLTTGAVRFERHTRTTPRALPRMSTLDHWALDSVVEATDGCDTEPDGICEHGYKSWFLVMGDSSDDAQLLLPARGVDGQRFWERFGRRFDFRPNHAPGGQS